MSCQRFKFLRITAVHISSQFDSIHIPTPTSLISILTLSSHLIFGLPSGVLPSRFANKTLYKTLLKHTAALHSWCQQCWGTVTLDCTRHLPSPQTLTNFHLQTQYSITFSCQHDKVREKKCTCKQLNSGILLYFLHSSLYEIEWQFINYSLQCLSDCVRNVSHITFYAYLHTLWESSVGLRLKGEMLLK